MREAQVAGLRWQEETITDLYLGRVHPEVKVRNVHQGRGGSEWRGLAVVVCGPRRCVLGILVQAKRLRIGRTDWHFDFSCRTGEQRRLLMKSAAELSVAPAYALYLGMHAFRGHVPPIPRHAVRRSVSVAPVLATHIGFDDMGSTYECSLPMEDLAEPSAGASLVLDPVRSAMGPDVLTFMTTAQLGARAVGRNLLDQVVRRRFGQFGAAAAETVEWHPREDSGRHEDLRPMFMELPNDDGHFEEPYFPNVLRGLRPSLRITSRLDVWGLGRCAASQQCDGHRRVSHRRTREETEMVIIHDKTRFGVVLRQSDAGDYEVAVDDQLIFTSRVLAAAEIAFDEALEPRTARTRELRAKEQAHHAANAMQSEAARSKAAKATRSGGKGGKGGV
jgi:hypothetical protein